VKPSFVLRDVPLPARAVAGGKALGARLLARPDDELAQVQVVVSSALIVAAGPLDLLPWADGASYLGSDPRAPALLLPTTLAPDVHPLLLERALRKKPGAAFGPLALLPKTGQVVPLERAAPPARARLLAWVNAP
jgi:hypothetical protein